MEFNMKSLGFLTIFVCAFMASTTYALDYYVGGRDGWVLNPTRSYNQWAGNMRFQVHDNLVFKYAKEEDSVLEVTEEDYKTCNVSKPIKRMGSGESWFSLDRAGSFFFISGSGCHCDNGQKMVVVVLNSHIPPSPSPLVHGPSQAPSFPPTHEGEAPEPASEHRSPSPNDDDDAPSPSPSPYSKSGAIGVMGSSGVVAGGLVLGSLLFV